MMQAILRVGCAMLIAAVLLCSRSLDAAIFQQTDPAHEVALGREAAKEIEKKEHLSTDKAAQERVQRIGRALVESLPVKEYPYEFKVLASPQINAFCLPGGFMYVYEGILQAMPDDNELAFVMGHEIGHAAHRHWAKHTEKLEGWQILGVAASVAMKDRDGYAASLATALMSLHYSREDENDADQFGITSMWRAGFDTKGALDAARVIMKLEQGHSVPAYLRDHPAGKDRLAHLQKSAEQLKVQQRPKIVEVESVDDNTDSRSIVGNVSRYKIASNKWFPLAVGNEWTYDVESNGSHARYTVRVVSAISTDTADTGNVYRVETTLGKDMVVSGQLLTTANEVWKRMKIHSLDSPWVLDHVITSKPYKVPGKSSSKFQYSGEEAISLPCGKFPTAVKMRKITGDPSRLEDEWFVEGIGMVRRVSVETSVTETLVSYKIASSGD